MVANGVGGVSGCSGNVSGAALGSNGINLTRMEVELCIDDPGVVYYLLSLVPRSKRCGNHSAV
jgi:hypothetical protein